MLSMTTQAASMVMSSASLYSPFTDEGSEKGHALLRVTWCTRHDGGKVSGSQRAQGALSA